MEQDLIDNGNRNLWSRVVVSRREGPMRPFGRFDLGWPAGPQLYGAYAVTFWL